MSDLVVYKVDAFTARPYAGNPAGVVIDAQGLSDAQMRAIAREMNLSETAFLLPPTAPDADMRLRYFTPTSEIRLCGHATVATFHVLVETGQLAKTRLRLETMAGVLDVEVKGEEVYLQSDPIVVEPSPLDAARVAELLGTERVDDVLLVKRMLFATVPGLKALQSLRPDLEGIAREYRERDVDGIVPVSFETFGPDALTHIRYFVPGVGIPEDPVTGAAHMSLAGYLLRLGKLDLARGPQRFVGEQGHVMGRPGHVVVEVAGTPDAPQVRIAGRAATVLRGHMRRPEA